MSGPAREGFTSTFQETGDGGVFTTGKAYGTRNAADGTHEFYKEGSTFHPGATGHHHHGTHHLGAQTAGYQPAYVTSGQTGYQGREGQTGYQEEGHNKGMLEKVKEGLGMKPKDEGYQSNATYGSTGSTGYGREGATGYSSQQQSGLTGNTGGYQSGSTAQTTAYQPAYATNESGYQGREGQTGYQSGGYQSTGQQPSYAISGQTGYQSQPGYQAGGQSGAYQSSGYQTAVTGGQGGYQGREGQASYAQPGYGQSTYQEGQQQEGGENKGMLEKVKEGLGLKPKDEGYQSTAGGQGNTYREGGQSTGMGVATHGDMPAYSQGYEQKHF